MGKGQKPLGRVVAIAGAAVPTEPPLRPLIDGRGPDIRDISGVRGDSGRVRESSVQPGAGWYRSIVADEDGLVAVGRYTIRRLLQMIPSSSGPRSSSTPWSGLCRGDPFVGKCGDRPCPASYIAEMRAKFNLDDSLPVQYGKYLWNLLQGNFGESFSGRTVWSEIAQAFPVTFRLALIAIIIEIVIGSVPVCWQPSTGVVSGTT